MAILLRPLPCAEPDRLYQLNVERLKTCVLVAGVGIATSTVPARRIAKLDPITVLRSD